MFSYMDVGENTAENFYYAFVLGMLVRLKDSYYVKSNRRKKYEEDLQERGYTNITKMVFAFKGKEVKMQVI